MKIFSLPVSHAWFLITLFIAEMLFYFLKKNSSDDFSLGNSVALCGIIGYVYSIFQHKQNLPFHLDAVFTAIVFYYIGYLFMKNIDVFKRILDSKIQMLLYGGGFGLVGFIAMYFNRRVSMSNGTYGSVILFYIGAIFTIFAVLLFVRLFLNKSFVFKNIGLNTLFYLGYHGIIIKSLTFTHMELFSSNIKIFVFAVVLTIFMYPFALLVKKYIPILIGKVNIKSLN